MENRRPAAAEAAPALRGNRARWLLLAAGILVIVLVLVSIARLRTPGEAGTWRDGGAQTVGQSTPAVQAPEPAGAPHAGPARIVDAAAASARPGMAGDPLAAIRPAPETTTADSAGPPPANVPAGPAASASRSGSRAAASEDAQRGAAGAEDENNLISTLLGIIRQDGGAAAEPSSMDSLVARILAENERTYSETNAALASLGQAQPGSADADAATPAQRELQACPAANTVQGINCRDRICARWAGRDPACPPR